MDVFERIFGRSSGSAALAKKRLKVVLTQDRTNISPEMLNVLKDEIVNAISKNVEIDSENVEVSMSEDADGQHLTVEIPVIGDRVARKQSRTKKT